VTILLSTLTPLIDALKTEAGACRLRRRDDASPSATALGRPRARHTCTHPKFYRWPRGARNLAVDPPQEERHEHSR
jgi:hypothetical protein